jgi:clan AA aspartic protease
MMRDMKGTVDTSGHALLPIRLRQPHSSTEIEVDAWVDTGFTGELMLPQERLISFGAPLGPTIHAVLADGSQVELQTYTRLLDWFGEWKRIELIATKGEFPLLGVGLLEDREININYAAKTVSVY